MPTLDATFQVDLRQQVTGTRLSLLGYWRWVRLPHYARLGA